jgi:rod shape-determining protein MreD
MSLLLLIPAVYLVAVLETSLAPWIEVQHVVPDLFALLAVLWLLRPGRQRGLVAAAAVGLACDLTAAGPLGIGMATFALAAYAIRRFRSRLDPNFLLMQLGVVWLAVTAIALVEGALWRLTSETALSWPTLAVRGASVGIYTAAIGLPLLMLLNRFRGSRHADLIAA